MSTRIRLLALWALLSCAIGCLGCHAPPPSLDASAPDASAGIEAETDDPDVVDLTPGIVPVPPHRVGANLPIPNPGDAGTVLTSNGLGAMPGWQPPAGGAAALPDGGAGAVWYESDAGTVAALPACANGQALVWDGGYPGCGTVSGGGDAGVTWANDLAGSSSTHQYVAGLSGNAGGGGAIPLASNAYISVAANVPILKYSTFDLMDVDTTDGYLNVNPPTGTGFNVRIGGTAGGTAFYADQQYLFSNGNIWELGANADWTFQFAGAGHDAIKISGQTAGTSGEAGGPVYISSGGSLTTGVPGTIGFNLGTDSGGTNHGVWQFGEGTSTVLGISPVANASAGGIAATSSTVPESTYLYTMAANAGAGSTSTGTPGSLNVVVPVPVSTGNEALLALYRGTSFAGGIGPYPGFGSTITGLWLEPGITPDTSNWTLYSSSGVTALNAPTELELTIATTPYATLTSSLGLWSVPIASNADLGVSLGTASRRWSGAYLGGYDWLGVTGTVHSQTDQVEHHIRNAQTTSGSATLFDTLTLASGHGATIKVIATGKVTAAGTSGLPVDGVLSSEYRITGGYNGTNIITSSGATGVESAVVWQVNANAVVTTSVSGSSLDLYVQWGTTGSPTIDWMCDVTVETN